MTESAAGPSAGGHSLDKNIRNSLPARENDDRIMRFALQAAAVELHPGHRVGGCLKAVIVGKDSVDVKHNPESHSAYYENLMRCGSVWVCPLCAYTITNRRRKTLVKVLMSNEGMAVVPDSDGNDLAVPIRKWFVAMVTYTLYHRDTEKCEDVFARMKRAYKNTWGGRWAVGFKSLNGIVGTIRAIEMTHGSNGWHPHIHQLLIFKSLPTEEQIDEIHVNLWKRWEGCVEQAGGYANSQAFDVRVGDEALIEYISKTGDKMLKRVKGWGVTSEITMSPVKRARGDGSSLWELLERYIKGDVRAGGLWIEAIDTLHGTKHLQASEGLWGLLGVHPDDLDDDKMALDEQSENDQLLLSLSLEQWRTILKSGKRGQLLRVASEGDITQLARWVRAVCVDFNF